MGSIVDKVTSVLTGGISDIAAGEDPFESQLAMPGNLIEVSTGGLSHKDESIGIFMTSHIDPAGALYFGGKKIKDEMSEPDAVQPGVSSTVPEIDPNATRALLARQFSPEEEAKRKDGKTKKGKKSQFKVKKDKTTSATSGVQVASDKTVGVQL